MMANPYLVRFKASDHLIFELLDIDHVVVRALGHKAIFELLKQCLDTPRCHARFMTVEFPQKAAKPGVPQRITGVEVDFKPFEGDVSDVTFKWKKNSSTRAIEGTGLRSGCTCLGYRTALNMVEQIARVCAPGDEFVLNVEPAPEDVKPSKTGKIPSYYKLLLVKQK